MKALSDERDHWRTTSEQAIQQQPKTTKIEDENRRLKSELAIANQKLDTFRMLLDGNGQPESTTEKQTTTGAVPRGQAKPGDGHGTEQGIGRSSGDAQIEHATEPNQDGEQGEDRQAQPIRYPGAIQDKHKDKDTASITRTSKSGGAAARAQQIFQAIQAWNNEKDRSERERWAITPGLLEEGFGIHRAAAKQFCLIHQAEITAHHHAAAITNPRSHNRSKDVKQIKDFVQQQQSTTVATTPEGDE